MTNSGKFCIYCGQKIPSEAVFCSSCGKAQEALSESCPVFESTPVYAPAPVRKKPKKKRALHLTRSILLLVMSIALIASVFLPIVKSTVEINKDVSFDISTSPINITSLFISSFDDMSEEDCTEEIDEVYEDAEDILEETYEELDNDGELSKETKKEYADFLASMIKTAYKYEGISAPAVMWTAVILTVLYIVFAILVFVISLIYFIKAIIDPENSGRASRTAITLFSLAPILLTALFYSSAASMCHSLAEISIPAGKISGAFIIMISAISATLIALMIINGIASRKTRETKLAPRIIAGSAALVVICSLFFPVATASIKTTFSGSEKSKVVSFVYDSGVFTTLHIGDDEEEYYEEAAENKTARKEYLDTEFSAFGYFTAKEAKRGAADSVSISYMRLVSSAFGLYEYWWVFALIPVIYTITLICAGIILWQNVSCLAGGAYSPVTSLIFKILTFIFALVALGTVISFVMLQRFYITELKLSKIYAFGLHFGICVMAALALANIFVPARQFRRKRAEAACPCTENVTCDTSAPTSAPVSEESAPAENSDV